MGCCYEYEAWTHEKFMKLVKALIKNLMRNRFPTLVLALAKLHSNSLEQDPQSFYGNGNRKREEAKKMM